jgi:hypothetical protein
VRRPVFSRIKSQNLVDYPWKSRGLSGKFCGLSMKITRIVRDNLPDYPTNRRRSRTIHAGPSKTLGLFRMIRDRRAPKFIVLFAGYVFRCWIIARKSWETSRKSYILKKSDEDSRNDQERPRCAQEPYAIFRSMSAMIPSICRWSIYSGNVKVLVPDLESANEWYI